MFKDKKKVAIYLIIVAVILLLPFACTQLKECTRSGSVSIKEQSVWVKLSCVF